MWSTICELVGLGLVLGACVALLGIWPAVLMLGLVMVLVGWLGGE